MPPEDATPSPARREPDSAGGQRRRREAARRADARERRALILVALALVADVMLLSALLGASLVLREASPGRFDGHAAEWSLHWPRIALWLVHLCALAVGGVLILGGRRLFAGMGLVLAVAGALTLLWFAVVMRGNETLLERIDDQVRFAYQGQVFEDEGGLRVRGRRAEVDWAWTPSSPLPDETERGKWTLQGTVLARIGDTPARQHFFAIAWLLGLTMLLHWVGILSLCVISFGREQVTRATGLLLMWTGFIGIAADLLLAGAFS